MSAVVWTVWVWFGTILIEYHHFENREDAYSCEKVKKALYLEGRGYKVSVSSSMLR